MHTPSLRVGHSLAFCCQFAAAVQCRAATRLLCTVRTLAPLCCPCSSPLAPLQGLAGMWVSRSKMRAQAMAAGLREPQFLDFGCRCLDCVLLDGWAVYRAQHPTYRVRRAVGPGCGDGL